MLIDMQLQSALYALLFRVHLSVIHLRCHSVSVVCIMQQNSSSEFKSLTSVVQLSKII